MADKLGTFVANLREKLKLDDKMDKTGEITGLHAVDSETEAKVYSEENPTVLVFYPET